MWVDSFELHNHSYSFIHHIACGNLSPGMSEILTLSRSSGNNKWPNMLHKLWKRPYQILEGIGILMKEDMCVYTSKNTRFHRWYIL